MRACAEAAWPASSSARCFATLRAKGLQAVEATVDRDNHGALSFYRRCGFSVEDRGLEGGAKVQIRLDLT